MVCPSEMPAAAPAKRPRLSDADTKPPPKKSDDEEDAGTDADPVTAAASVIASHSFPQRLMEMLDQKVAPDTVWWAEEGKAFAIDLDKFDHVLHHHFQATKYASFTRKLNKWYVRQGGCCGLIRSIHVKCLTLIFVTHLRYRGFRKLNNAACSQSDSVVVYRHDLFQKGFPELLATMSTKRKKAKKDKTDNKAAKKKKTSEEGGTSAVEEKQEASAPQRTDRVSRYTTLPGRDTHEAEAKAGESKREPDFSLASLVSNRRFLDQQPFHISSSTSPSVDWFRQRALQQGRLGINTASLRSDEHDRMLLESLAVTDAELTLGINTASLRSDEHDRMLLESLAATDAELILQQRAQMQAMAASSLYGSREQQLLSDEMIAQRQLSASAAAEPFFGSLDASSLSLQDRLLAAEQNAGRGLMSDTRIHSGRPTSLADLTSARELQHEQELSNMASSLRGFQNLAMRAAVPPSMSLLQSQSLPDARASMRRHTDQQPRSDISSRLDQASMNPDTLRHLLAQERYHHASLVPSRPHMGFLPSDQSSQARQLLLEQRRQELQSSTTSSGLVGRLPGGLALAAPASATEQRLVAIMMERQQLEAQLLEEQRRRQQQE